jgi:DNA processing protein
MPTDNRWAEFLLETLPGMNPASVGLLRATLAAAEVDLRAWLDLSPKRRAKVAPLPDLAERALPGRLDDLRRLEAAGAIDLWLLREGDPGWPMDALAALGEEAPGWLVGWGNASLLAEEMVAVVGSREATEESLQVAEILARALVEIDRTVLSGGARGIDQTAHQAALVDGGKTVFALPEGLAQARDFGMRHDVDAQRVAMISMLWPFQRWSTPEAHARNRLIAALAQAVIVVAAKSKGGSVATGMAALEMDRPTLAVDHGKVTVHTAGNHRLLQAGAIALSHEAFATGHAPNQLREALGLAKRTRPEPRDLFGDLAP